MRLFRREPTSNPAYRLIIPTTQLSILNRWDPRLKVLKVVGDGTYSDRPRTESFELGNVITKLVSNIILDWEARGMDGGLSLHEIHDKISGRYPDAEISIETLTSYRIWSETDYIWLKFERESIHPTILKKMIVNSGIPKQQTFELLHTLKEKLGEKEELPEAARKRWKPSYLILTDTLPDRTWIYDPARLRPLMKHYMILAVDTIKGWEIKDMELKRKGM